jgi:hypothetical protein
MRRLSIAAALVWAPLDTSSGRRWRASRRSRARRPTDATPLGIAYLREGLTRAAVLSRFRHSLGRERCESPGSNHAAQRFPRVLNNDQRANTGDCGVL